MTQQHARFGSFRTRGLFSGWLAGFLVLAASFQLLFPGAIQAIERRRDQFPTNPAYFLLPLPYKVPGIGEGMAFVAQAANIYATTDVSAVVTTGDVAATYIGVDDLPIIPRKLSLNAYFHNVDRLLINNYDTRGMDSDPNSLTIMDLSQFDGFGVELCLCLFQRRFSLAAGYNTEKTQLDNIRDADGAVIPGFVGPYNSEKETRYVRVMFDFTDDFNDPRKGVRAEVKNSTSPQDNLALPEFSVVDYNVSFYIPFGKSSTLVLNGFRSDADVSRTGNTDGDSFGQNLFGCNYADCQQYQKDVIDNFIASNQNGTSTPLGGFTRLRSYGEGRFQGAHTLFYGAEFRWNLTDEATPFNYGIWKDVRTAMQVAFFFERGTVAETKAELGNIYRETYGAGFRLLSGSGYVYRADLAWGSEGFQPTLIFDYPW